MSWLRYPSYQKSESDNFGAVPSHWQIAPLKRLFQIVGGSTPRSDVPAYWDGDVVWVTPGDLSGRTSFGIEDSARRLTVEGLASCGSRLVPAGTIILSTRAPIGSVAIARTELSTNQGCKSLIPADDVDSYYFAYLLQSTTDRLSSLGKGTTFLELSGDALGGSRAPVPPFDEQRKIARFLQREAARVDELIEKQERLIKLLQEKRQALITRAVTKGLDPTVPMKDSGVEWLGQVPAHWKVAKLKHVAQVRGGVAKGRNLKGMETVWVPYLRVANVQDGYIDLSEVSKIEVAISEVERYRLRKGDVLMNEGGDYDKLGRGDVWSGEIDPCLHQNHVFAVRPIRVDSHWLSTLTGSDYAKRFFESRAKQTTNLASISSSNLSELPVVLPPTDEQRSIVAELAKQNSLLNSLVDKAQMMVERSKEHRGALISAAVTGKIDVRNQSRALGKL